MHLVDDQSTPVAKRALWVSFYSPGVFSIAAFLFSFGVPGWLSAVVAACLWVLLLAWVVTGAFREAKTCRFCSALGWGVTALSGMLVTAGLLMFVSLPSERRTAIICWLGF